MSDKYGDKELVKTIVLSNNDRFYFSRKYDVKYVENAIIRAEKAYAIYEKLSFFPDIIAQVKDEFRRKSIHGTVAIEGNPLTEDEVGTVLRNKEKKYTSRPELEVLNASRAYELLETMVGRDTLFEDDIKNIHSILMHDIDNKNAGKYRIERVKVGDIAHGGVDTPPDRIKDIRLLMNLFIEFINSPVIMELHPIVRGALAHYHLARIHPFLDGNGRTSRIVEAFIMNLSNMKYMPDLLSYRYNIHVNDYYLAFSKSRKNKKKDVTDFIKFVCAGVNESLNYAGDKIVSIATEALLLNRYKVLLSRHAINKRQHDLLQTILKTSEHLSFQEIISKVPYKLIFQNVSDRTVRRDMEKLVHLELIELSEKGIYNIKREASNI